MKEQRKNAPRTKSVVMTRLTGSGAPTVTYALIGLTLVVFVLQWVPGLGITDKLLYAGVYSFPGNFEPWRMLTTAFVHSQGFIFHVLLNMYMLWIFGQQLEGMLGRARFLTLYLVSGFAGSVGVLVLSAPNVAVVGASGAIFGLMGAFLVIQRGLGGNATQLLVLLGINFVIGFIPGLNIAWQAHLGGLIGGALMGLIFMKTRRLKQTWLQVALIAGLVIALALLGTLKVLSYL
ncbi:rhomboid family intramembrane serine protease [Cryobacterium roopkundense]|nr:membrane associated rhomboid family serine protease [Cryobacterium roopkundense]